MARVSDFSKGSEIYKEFLKLINPLLLPREESSSDLNSRNSAQDDEEIEDAMSDEAEKSNDEAENDLDSHSDFEFHMETGSYPRSFKIRMDEPVPIPEHNERIKVCVTWSEKMIKDYDTSILSRLPDVFTTDPMSKGNEDSISLYKCVEGFLKEEPLGPDDMWYLSI